MKARFASPALVFCVGLFALSCASAPPTVAGDPVSVSLASVEEVKRAFGPGQATNPFLAPHDLLQRAPYDFIVLKIAFAPGASGKARFGATHSPEGEGQRARLLSLEELVQIWRDYPVSDEMMAKREGVIDRNCVPPNEISVRGRQVFWAVLSGPHPLGSPAHVRAWVDFAAGPSYPFDFDLPAAPSK